MKKRIITLLAVLALLVTCAVFAVQAEETETITPKASTVTLTGDETCPVCSKKLSEITDWVEATSAADFTAEHVIIKNDLTLTSCPSWGATAQTILIRSSDDFSEAATAVTVSMNANQQFTGSSYLTKALAIYGDKATLESKMRATNGGMFRTATGADLKVYGDITIRPMEGASAGGSGGIIFVNKGTAKFTGVTFEGVKGTTGGVIYQTNGGSISGFTNCTFNNCTANAAGVAFLQGGAGAGFTNCDFNNCSAATGAGGVIQQDTYLHNSNKSYQALAMKLTDCTFVNCTAKTSGGAVYSTSGSTTLTNCVVSGCSAGEGGAFYSNVKEYTNDSAAKLYLYANFILDNTTVSDCTATTNGGVLYIKHHGDFTVKNSTIKNCTAGAKGGLVCTASSKTPDIILEDSVIDGCKALTVTEKDGKKSYSGNGGAIYLYGGKVTMTEGKPTEFKNCESGGKGGTIYMSGGTFNMNSGSISLSSAHTNGGTVLVAGGTFEMRNEAIITANPNNAYNASKGIRLEGGHMRMQGNAKVVSTGNGVGNGIYVISLSRTAAQTYLQMVGNTSVIGPNGEHKGNIAVIKYDGAGEWPKDETEGAVHYTYGLLKIQEGWSGDASVCYQTLLGAGYASTTVKQVPGSINVMEDGKTSVDNKFAVVMKMVNVAAEGETAKWEEQLSTAGASIKGTLFAECDATENPQLNGWTHELMPYRSQIVKADGTKYWVVDNDKAWDDLAANEGSYLKLWTDRYLKNITGNVTVDLNGHVPTADANNAAVSFSAENPGTLTVVDSAAKAGEKGVTIPTTEVTTGMVKVADKNYVVVAGETDATVYPVEFKMTSVSLRAAQDALYYTASIKAHAEVVAKSGVAVTVDPEATTNSLENFLYTNGTNSEGAYTGVLVKDILFKNSAEDATKPVIARAYVELADGTIFMSDAASYSLTTLVNAVVEQQYDKLEGTKLEQFVDLYNRLDAILGEELVALPVKDEE